MKRLILFLMLVAFVLPSWSQQADTMQYANYGGKMAYGVAIGGGGLVGVPLRVAFNEQLGAEFGAYLRPAVVAMPDATVMLGLMFTGGTNMNIKNSFNAAKGKVRRDGIFIRGGAALSKTNDAMISVGWVRDHFKLNDHKKSFTIELGGGAMYSHYTYSDSGPGWSETVTYQGFTPMLHWKFSWMTFK